MFKILKVTIFFLFFFNTYVLSNEQKIVYLNLDYIIQNSIPGKLILQELDDQQKENINRFKLRKNDLLDIEQDIIKKKNILSKEDFEAEAINLNKEMKKYNEERKKTLLKLEENKKKKLNEFLEKITPLIQKFVKENSINIVLNEKNLFIANKKFDITNQIIEIVNKNIK